MNKEEELKGEKKETYQVKVAVEFEVEQLVALESLHPTATLPEL